jgi:hypothetical protein
MKARKNVRSFPPPKGTSESFEMVDAGRSLTPEQVEALYDSQGAPHPARPLVPNAEELAKLPAAARAAYLARCGHRVAPLRTGDGSPSDPQTAAALILMAALVRTPVRRQLRAIRKDYDRPAGRVRSTVARGPDALVGTAEVSVGGPGTAVPGPGETDSHPRLMAPGLNS